MSGSAHDSVRVGRTFGLASRPDWSDFFSQERYLASVAEHVRTALDAHPERLVEIWCASCGTGEGPLSVAMAIADHCGPAALQRVFILATDESEVAIERARRGVYGASSFRYCSPALRDRYFVQEPPREVNGREAPPAWRPSLLLRAAVTYRVQSASTCASELGAGTVDVAVLRHVGLALWYPTLIHTFWRVAEGLRADGLLVLGPGDPRPGLAFETVGRDTHRVRRRTTPTPVAARAPVSRVLQKVA